MGAVRIELMSWLADTVNVEAGGQRGVFEEDLGSCRTVKDLLMRLASLNAQFGKSVFDLRGLSLSSGVAIFHNGRQVELENGLQTELKDGDSLVFMPVIAGG